MKIKILYRMRQIIIIQTNGMIKTQKSIRFCIHFFYNW